MPRATDDFEMLTSQFRKRLKFAFFFTLGKRSERFFYLSLCKRQEGSYCICGDAD